MSFLTIAPSARIASLGGGGFSNYAGSSSQWSNPALVALAHARNAEFTHTEWIDGITREYASFVTGLSYGSLGLSAQMLDSGDIDGRDQFGGSTGSYRITTAGISVTYAAPVASWLYLGGTYKQLFQKVAEETAGGYAIDAGLFILTPVEGLQFGMSARNYGRMAKLREERTKLPESAALGFSYIGLLPNYDRPYQIVADAVFPRFGKDSFRTGIEVGATEHFVLRLGYRDDSYFETMIYGIGFVWERITADIAYSPLNDISDDALRFTLALTGF